MRTRPVIETLERRLLLAAALVPVGQQPVGALTGKIVFASGGHGFTSDHPDGTAWRTQRGLTHGMVEDLGNQDQLTAYVNYLWNAGATVVPLRPVGHQPNEVVLDNDSAGVTFTGAWSNSTGSPWYGEAGDAVHYRFATASATETAVARYAPNLPAAGYYPVYAWALDGDNRATDQLYRVVHAGGATEVKVNHRRVGKGWVYLGTYHFRAGTGAAVEISNRSSASVGSAVIADAIRFGNGVGDVRRGSGAVSGRNREDEAALYWIMRSAGQGVASSVYAPNGDDSDDSVGAPIRFAAHMNRETQGPATDRVYLGFHSNAGGGSARGTLALYNSPANDTPNQLRWAELVGREVTDDLVSLNGQFEHDWHHRSTVTLDRSDLDFGEINGNSLDDNASGTIEMDATILEVAFHDNVEDAELMRDPRVRDAVGRASYQATVRYFAEFAGALPTMAPAAPTHVRAVVNADGSVTVSWNPPASSAALGGAATGYRVYASEDGLGYDGGTAAAGTSLTIPASSLGPGAYAFRVAAVNAGGQSPLSAAVAARKGATARSRVLIVNGFDRLDRTLDPRQTLPLVTGGSAVTVDRVRPWLSNSFDYVARAAEAIEATGHAIGIDSASNEALLAGQVNLALYHTVIWLAGEESTADDTFNATEAALVSTYVNSGGKLFVSGSEIAWDLGAQGGNPTFLANTLRASYSADSAGGFTAAGAAGSIFAGLSLSFDDGSAGTYRVDSPDRIAPANGSMLAMSYTAAGSGGAAVQWEGGNGARVVYLAFPFETITTAAGRNAVMAAVLNSFGTAATPAPGAPDLAAASDTGIADADNLTRLDNGSAAARLTFTIPNTLPGATVTLWHGSTVLGSAVATGSSTTLVTNGTTRLPVGVRSITAKQALPGLTPSPAPAALAITVDVAAPAADVVDVAPDPRGDAVGSVSLTFTEAVYGLETADLSLARNGLPIPWGSGVTVQGSGASWTVLGLGPLTEASGAYVLTLAAGSVTDAAGNPPSVTASDAWKTATPLLRGTAGPDAYLVTLSPDGTLLRIFENEPTGAVTPTYELPRPTALASGLRIETLAGADSVVLDLGASAGLLPLTIDPGGEDDGLDALTLASGRIVLATTASARWGCLSIDGTGRAELAGAATLRARAVTLGASATLDLGSASLLVDGGEGEAVLPGLSAAAARARGAEGTWSGPGLTSSLAAADAARLTSVGLLLREDGSVLARPTRAGDANLDGVVNADDVLLADAGFMRAVTGGATSRRAWQDGDFNFDARIDAADYHVLDRAMALLDDDGGPEVLDGEAPALEPDGRSGRLIGRAAGGERPSLAGATNVG